MTLMVLGLAACASRPQPFDYHDDRDEKPGPGLFSGDEGAFIITGGSQIKTPGIENEPTVKE